jgi:hypothetical protein
MDGPGARRRPEHGRNSRPYNEERCLLIRTADLRGACSLFSTIHARTDVCVYAIGQVSTNVSRCSTCVPTSPSFCFCRADGSRRGQRPSTAMARRCPTRSGSSLSTAGRAHLTSGPICLRLYTGCNFSSESVSSIASVLSTHMLFISGTVIDRPSGHGLWCVTQVLSSEVKFT